MLSMMMLLLPSSLILCWASWAAPFPTASMVMTEQTPKMIPRMVSPERSFLSMRLLKPSSRVCLILVILMRLWLRHVNGHWSIVNGLGLMERAWGDGVGLAFWFGFYFILVDESVFHADDAVCVLCDGFIVGDDDDGFSAFV